ncbi:MAG: 3-dehydroquinate synthase [Gammaproteobacteria bacterium]|nr:3-dehydroquinate synthase [Gammaproteobacteria bacterium]
MLTVKVDLGDRSYPIFIGEDLLSEKNLIEPYLGKGRVVIVSNDVVAPLYLEQAKALFSTTVCDEIILKDGEAFKNLDAINQIYDFLLKGKYDRNTTLVALGGGVVGDVAGFAAATYLRGVNFIQLPTTLLAQVDSSVGGKTGVNHPLGKNMIGAFYQPQCVVIDTRVLSTLPERELKAGLAESLKYGLIYDPLFFQWMIDNSQSLLQADGAALSEAIRKCCETKADIVAQDEKETGIRALLNFGHTFGHAIETASGYGTWLHGESVAMGMVMAADLSSRLGLIEAKGANSIRDVIEKKFGMPALPPADISVEQYLDLMSSDKKAELGNIRFVLLKSIGDAVVEGNIDPHILQQTLQAGDRLCE